MSTTQHPTRAVSDPVRLAGAARSVLACPATVDLVVDGVPGLLEGGDPVGMQDVGGSPTFSCARTSPLAEAARETRSALVTVHSGLGPTGGAERRDRLILAGRLRTRSTGHCDCCGEARDLVALEPDFVLLARTAAHGEGGGDRRLRVPVEQFGSPVHHLNRGVLQRSAEHANDSHQEELRAAVALTSQTPLHHIAGVRLTGLSTHGVEVQWVEPAGARTAVLRFPRPARTVAELGALVRRTLHAGPC